MGLSRDDFARWREDPVTRWVFRALERRVEEQRQQWLLISWQNGAANQAALQELRTRASAWVEVFDKTYEEWCADNDQEPVDE